MLFAEIQLFSLNLFYSIICYRLFFSPGSEILGIEQINTMHNSPLEFFTNEIHNVSLCALSMLSVYIFVVQIENGKWSIHLNGCCVPDDCKSATYWPEIAWDFIKECLSILLWVVYW